MKNKTTRIIGHLEIDHERGVIYFHNTEGYTTLRLCNVPTPVPEPERQTWGHHKPLFQLDYCVEKIRPEDQD